MKKDSVKDFMKTHQQKMEDERFKSKLAARLEFCPAPKKVEKKSSYIAFIPLVGFFLAILVIWLVGGLDVYIRNMTYTRLHGLNILWPTLTSLLMLFLSWLIIQTINWEKSY